MSLGYTFAEKKAENVTYNLRVPTVKEAVKRSLSVDPLIKIQSAPL